MPRLNETQWFKAQAVVSTWCDQMTEDGGVPAVLLGMGSLPSGEPAVVVCTYPKAQMEWVQKVLEEALEAVKSIRQEMANALSNPSSAADGK